MSMKFDKTLLIKNITAQTEKKAKAIVDNVLNQVVDSLMFHSPVGQPEKWKMFEADEDYTPGKYKANWIYSAGTPIYDYDDSESDNSFKQADCATGRVLKKHIAVNKKLITTHYFTNSTPYAEAIEFGGVPWQSKHNPQSQTFPIAVAGLTAQNIPIYLAKAVAEVK